MGPILFFLLLAVPVAELYVIVQVAGALGVLETFALLIAISVAGAWLLRQQGLATWMRLQETLARGEMPTREVTDGALILLGGALLLTPGFLTDAVGIVFLLPPTRAMVKAGARRLFARWAERRFVPGGRRIYSATVIRQRPSDSSRPGGPPPKAGPGSLPRESGGDGSPDTG
jgi:UPF0716 protein FxsA